MLHLEKAKCFKKLSDFQQMKESAQKAYQIDYQSSEILLNLGIALVETGKHSDNNTEAILDIDSGINKLSQALTIATHEHEQAGS